jgi:zinc protease
MTSGAAGPVTARPVPALEPATPPTMPAMDDRRLAGGMRLLTVSHPVAPLVELRLRIPLPVSGSDMSAQRLILTRTMLAGTARFDRVGLVEHLDDVGATLNVDADWDALVIFGVARLEVLEDVLAVLADVLSTATHPESEVNAERDRHAQRLRMLRSTASARARQTLHRHLFRDHPYGTYLPEDDAVAAVTAEDLRAMHHRFVVPTGATMILVGDIDSGRAAAAVTAALAGWSAHPVARAVPETPALPALVADPSLLVHRPGSVQSSIRIGGRALRRDDPDYPALQLANLIYGGYFSSRLVGNIREDKGYTYTPRSRLEHGAAGSTLVVEADVATEVTAPALLEMWYELGRLSTLRPTEAELDDVRQYAIGSLALSIATSAGLASTLDGLLGAGLDPTWIRDQPGRLAAVSAADIYRIGVHVLAPCRLAAVVIGDAEQTAEPLQAFGPWEVTAPGD